MHDGRGEGREVLVSVYNWARPASGKLLVVGLAGGTVREVPLEAAGELDRCMGLCRQTDRLYVLLASDDRSLLLGIDALTLRPRFAQPLPEVKDGHSLAFSEADLFVVSSGTDEVLRCTVGPAGVTAPELVWAASSAKADTHHLNSMVVYDGSLLISASGPKTGGRWSTAAHGYIHDVTKDVRVAENIVHPHALCLVDGAVYYCESRRRTLTSLDGPVLTLDGYARGLGWLGGRLVCVGTSVGRDPEETPPAFPGSDPVPAGRCRLTVVDLDQRRAIAGVDLGGFGTEVYDTAPR